jgi:hypothetical protein
VVATRTKSLLTAAAMGLSCCLSAAAWAADPIAPTPAPGTLEKTPASATKAAPAEPAVETKDAAPEAAAPAAWPPGLLMDGLKPTPVGKGMDSLGLRVWGFVEGGFTGRLTGGQNPLPLMGFESARPNNALLHQLRLTVDRPYDASKPLDFGFRIDGLYGSDARFTRSLGLFDHGGNGDGSNWGDLMQMYGQAWIKTGPESGLEITGGKFVTTIGAEIVDATGNALFSHSYLFNCAEPVTHTGVKLNYVINPQVSVYVAAVEGADVFEDNNDAWSILVGGALNSTEQIDGHARGNLALNVLTGPEQADNVSNQRTVIDVIGTYWWTNKLVQMVNFDYGVEAGAAADGGSDHWYGVANYFTYTINDNLAATWRTEWFRDDGGSRTGFTGNFYENTWGITITPAPNDSTWKNLLLRPELRWDHSDQAAYGGDRQDQLTLGFDVIFKF